MDVLSIEPGSVGADLHAVQRTIASIATAIRRFEPVRILARPAARRVAASLVGSDIEVIDAPVDDLWARDTLPLFLKAIDPTDATPLAACRLRFNGWGGKQIHAGDARLARLVAEIIDVPLIDSGLTGEGGGLEVDGMGTLLASRSSWVNTNRNPGRSESEIETARLYPDREIVQIDIDPVAEGGGGIHCATQQQPAGPI